MIYTFKIKPFKPILFLIKKLEILSSLACRLVKITGKSRYSIHPKHLINNRVKWFYKYIKSKDIVLDIGCHNGQNTIKVAKKCKKIIGIDKDKKAINQAKAEAGEKGIHNIQFIYFDVENKLPFKNNSFNKVLCFALLEHLYRRKQLLREICRILKKNGYLLISVPNKDTTWKKIQKNNDLFYYSDPDHKIEYSQKSILSELRSNGFEIIKMSTVALDMPAIGIIDLIGGLSLSLYRIITGWRKQIVKKYPNESVSFEIVVKKRT